MLRCIAIVLGSVYLLGIVSCGDDEAESDAGVVDVGDVLDGTVEVDLIVDASQEIVEDLETEAVEDTALEVTEDIPTDAAGDLNPPHDVEALEEARGTIGFEYGNVADAIEAGFTSSFEFIMTPDDSAGMGIRFVTPSGGEVDAMAPNVLIYGFFGPGIYTLWAAGWSVPAEGLSEPPSLFDVSFEGPIPSRDGDGNEHYEMITWLWNDNPGGIFAPYNPEAQPPTWWDDLSAAREAVTAFEDPDIAIEAGYERAFDCDTDIPGGALPYVNTEALEAAPVLTAPSVLLYEPTFEGDRLVAFQYRTSLDAVEEAPTVLEHELFRYEPEYDPDGGWYQLTVWLPKINGQDLFASQNRRVACPGPFQLDISFTGFNDHIGRDIYAAVVRDADGWITRSYSTTVSDATFDLSFEEVLRPETGHTLFYYIDVDGSGVCDEPPGDAVWSRPIPQDFDDVTLNIDHDVEYAEGACETFGPFDFGWNGAGYEDWEGDRVEILLQERVLGSWVSLYSDNTTIADGAFTFDAPEIIQLGSEYLYYLHIDSDGNGSCDPAPMDHSWQGSTWVGTPDGRARGDVIVSWPPSEHYHDDACNFFGPFDFVFHVEDETYVGKELHLTVVRDSDSTVVGSHSDAVSDMLMGFITFENALDTGESHTLYVYVDVDGSGGCDAPPTDASWELAIGPATYDYATELVTLIDEGTETNVCAHF